MIFGYKRVYVFTLLSGALLLAPFANSTVQSAAPMASSVLPQFVFGGGWYSALYFTNLTGSPVSFPVNFVSDAGSPLNVPSVGGPSTQVNLAASGTAIIEAPNVGSLVQGYAAFTLPIGVFGYGVFRQSVAGQPDQEAVVPLSDAGATSTTLTWDDTSFVTSVAIVNPSSTATTVTVTLWDDNGNPIGNASVVLPPNSKTANQLRRLFGLEGMVGKRGTAQFSASAGSVAVLGLRFDNLAFTSIPTTGSSGTTSRSSVLSQLAFGGGWYTALYFTNLSGSPVSFPVNFVSDAGTPLTVPPLGETTRVNLPANGTDIIEARNVGGLVEGYAAFTLPAGVFGYGVFRQSVAGQSDQEAVVPLTAAGATSTTLTWDETKFVTAVAVVNPSSTAANVAVTLADESGNPIGNAFISLPPNSKTANVLRNLPGLSGMVGKRGSAKFSVSAGSVAVLGLRFSGSAFTSVPTTGPFGNVVAERTVAQTGLAIGLASTVLQSQFAMLSQIVQQNSACTMLNGGGSVRWVGPNAAAAYYDTSCRQPYVATNPGTTVTTSDSKVVASEAATYYAPSGAILGTLALNETVQFATNTLNLFGLGVFTPVGGAKTPVQLGLWCALTETTNSCAGGVAQDFPALGIAIGAVTPLALTLTLTDFTAPVTFTGTGSAVTGPIGSLTLTNPSPISLVIQGGTPYTSLIGRGGAAAFELFPPTPTSWTLTDSAHDQQFQISVIDNSTRNLNMTIKQMSSGITLATGGVDQSGTGTITYSDGSAVAITNWTLAN
jgi:hypothetical protein